MALFEKKRILVTGTCGTVGSSLVHQLLKNAEYGPSEVIGLDNNESELFFLDQAYADDSRASFFVADIRSTDALARHMKDIDIVFHTAALKHVILSERSPDEAVYTNIHGVQNVISAAYQNKVEKVIFTSSDKAVNPTNVMGTTKLMGERLMTSANSNKRPGDPIFASTRFGNVLGSNGSVVQIFRSQIKVGGPVTLTDPEMTRFVMSIEDSVKLVLASAELACGGEVFITKMPVIRISDLASVMIESLAPQFGFNPADIEIKIIGVKPGEKMYEELMSTEETRRSIELEHYFSVLPAFRSLYQDIDYTYPGKSVKSVTNPYNSSLETALSKQQIHNLLDKFRLLD